MKIVQLLDTYLPLTNEESNFVDKHSDKIKIYSLHEREEVVARNLVRKGIYEISKDNQMLIKVQHEKINK
jgi:hypothetical protein